MDGLVKTPVTTDQMRGLPQMAAVTISGRKVGPGQPCFIIAEAGVNHNGSLETAMRLVEAAAKAGADAVKFQTFHAERVVSAAAPKAAYQRQTTNARESQLAMIKQLELPFEAFRVLQAHCRATRIQFLSTPFHEDSADFLEELGVPAFKIPSGELTNLPFLAHVARTGRPMIVSTGMATLEEVEEAVGVIGAAGNPPLILLHCVSNYPADPRDVNLLAMRTMAWHFHRPVGYSDHTPGPEVTLAAVALGACVIEKHLTLDRLAEGPDHRSSVEPAEFAALVRGIRTVEASLGHGRKEPAESEADTAAAARKSLVAAQDIPVGRTVTQEAIAIQRPGTGLAPAMLSQVVGRTARKHISAGTLLMWDMLQ